MQAGLHTPSLESNFQQTYVQFDKKYLIHLMFSCNLIFSTCRDQISIFYPNPRVVIFSIVLPIVTFAGSITYWFSSNISNNICLADILLVTIIDTYINDKCIFINFYSILGWVAFSYNCNFFPKLLKNFGPSFWFDVA